MLRYELPFQSQNKKYYDFGFRFILFLRVLNQAGDSGLTLTDLMLPPPMEIWSNLTDLTLALLNSLEWQSCRHVSNVPQCLEGRVQCSYTAITKYDTKPYINYKLPLLEDKQPFHKGPFVLLDFM